MLLATRARKTRSRRDARRRDAACCLAEQQGTCLLEREFVGDMAFVSSPLARIDSHASMARRLLVAIHPPFVCGPHEVTNFIPNISSGLMCGRPRSNRTDVRQYDPFVLHDDALTHRRSIHASHMYRRLRIQQRMHVCIGAKRNIACGGCRRRGRTIVAGGRFPAPRSDEALINRREPLPTPALELAPRRCGAVLQYCGDRRPIGPGAKSLAFRSLGGGALPGGRAA
jgi:hypothetical protein